MRTLSLAKQTTSLAGNGILIYEARGSAQMARRVGTRLDRLVLAVALGSVGRFSVDSGGSNPFSPTLSTDYA